MYVCCNYVCFVCLLVDCLWGMICFVALVWGGILF